MNTQEEFQKVTELLSDFSTAMLTSTDEHGHLHSSPMATQDTSFDGSLWFFSRDDAEKLADISERSQVNVSYSDIDNAKFVSVCGSAFMVRNPMKNKELWNPAYEAWFPDGLEDPHLCLIRIDVASVKFWDSPSSKMVQIFGIARALVKGEDYKGEGSGLLQFDNHPEH